MSLNPRIPSWQGQVVWLVGASTGIGRAAASALHAAGARVVVSARSAEALDAFVRAHPGALALPLDVSDAPALRAAAAAVVQLHGRIDLAVYCAGYYKAMRATAFDLADAMRHEQVNYVGALNLLDAVLPVLLKQRGGHLSLVASVSGYRGLPNALAYGPTKAALINLAESAWFDLHDQGIGVSGVCPGIISAEQAAAEMLAGWQAGQFELHFPKRFTRWVKLASHLPAGLWFRLVRKVTGL